MLHKPKSQAKGFSQLELMNVKDGDTLREPSAFGTLRGVATKRKRDGVTQVYWTWRYTSPATHKERDLPCGTWRSDKTGDSMSDIRKVRNDAYAQVHDNKNKLDPLIEKRVVALAKQRKDEEEIELAERKKSEGKTVGDLVEMWLKNDVHQKDENKSLRWQCGKYILPKIGHILLSKITEDDVRGFLLPLIKEHTRTGRQVHANLIRIFEAAESRPEWDELIKDTNIVRRIKIKNYTPKGYTGTRDRFLSREEITKLDTAFHDLRTAYAAATPGTKCKAVRPLAETTEAAIWIMLATGCRVGELSKARWKNVLFKEKIWHIPAADTKELPGGIQRELNVHLSEFTLSALKRLQGLTRHTPWLFPRKPNAKGEVTGSVGTTAFTKQIADRQTMFSTGKTKQRRRQDNTLVLGDRNWTSHDLRRTFSTIGQELSIPFEAIDRCQNHSLGHAEAVLIKALRARDEGQGVRKNYFRFGYDDATIAAWNKVGAYLKKNAPHAFKRPVAAD